jgi:sulfur-oxidizing protein SoxA
MILQAPAALRAARASRGLMRLTCRKLHLPLALSFVALGVMTWSSCAAEIPANERRSGYDEMSRETRAMQDDDTANPAMFSVLDGEALWSQKAGEANRACADCHGDAQQSMKGVAARYPAFDAARRRPVNLEQRINICRTERQKAPALAPESKDLLALEAFVGRQSRGVPISIAIDKMVEFLETGRLLFHRRQGQLNLSCSQCHDDSWGKRLAGNVIPQGHPTGYPLYRLEWQNLGSLQRRLRDCMTGVRAEPFEYGAPEAVALELYLMERARGMPIETPAVRP